jgi:hypothetical protein
MKRLMRWSECSTLMAMDKLTSKSSTKWPQVNRLHQLEWHSRLRVTWKSRKDLARACQARKIALTKRRQNRKVNLRKHQAEK